MYLKEKHYFMASNSSYGFICYYDNIFKTEELNHLYILKGGPGVGKSSFMKKFANTMMDHGYFVEYVHCSSDPESLDGIIVPKLKVAFVDGTAPHTIDPVIPGAVDEIINLGDFLDSNGLEKHKAQIVLINKNKKEAYKSAYNYLEAAGIIFDEVTSYFNKFVDNKKFNAICEESLNTLYEKYFNKNKSNKPGSLRKMFSEAYTSSGYVSYTSSLYTNNKVLAVVSENKEYSSKLLTKISNECINRGYDVECYYMPLYPDKILHLLIPELNLFIITSDNYMSLEYEILCDLNSIIDEENLKSYISEIESNLHLFDELIKNALSKLSSTKKLHELLEVYYKNNIDFAGVDKLFEMIIAKYT